MGSKPLTCLLASVLALALTWGPAAGESREPGATAVRTGSSAATTLRKLALGVSMLPYDDMAAVDAFTASVGGHTPAIWSIWRDWGDTTRTFPAMTFLNGLKARHIVPMVMWQPVDGRDPTRAAFTYHRINQGFFDDYIRKWATKAKAWGGRIILRFAHEMDGRWFPWGIGNFDNTPAKFVKAWKRIWTIFKGPGGVGATNVAFLWSPLAPCACQPDLYPGDGYVDYVGMSAFNWGGADWRPLIEPVHRRYLQLRQLTHKPIILAETGSAPGVDKAAWITKGYQAVYTDTPSIKAVVYFNVDMRAGSQPDWRLTSPAKALAAYAKLFDQAQFRGRIR